MSAADARSQDAVFDVEAIRRDFPILRTENRGKPLVYFDTAASSQKPQIVIDTLVDFYTRRYANIHRGLYQLSVDATRRFEEAREKVGSFLNAADSREIVFLRNATEAINLVAMSWGRQEVGEGDEFLAEQLKHVFCVLDTPQKVERHNFMMEQVQLMVPGDAFDLRIGIARILLNKPRNGLRAISGLIQELLMRNLTNGQK